MTEIYSVGPLTTGSGLNITVWSYVDQLNISVLSDGATLEDPHELTDAMIDAFIEIRRAAGLSEELTVVEQRAMAHVAASNADQPALGLHPVQEVVDRRRGVVPVRRAEEVERVLRVRNLGIHDDGRPTSSRAPRRTRGPPAPG